MSEGAVPAPGSLSGQTLEDRVRRIETRSQLRELVDRYGYLLDAREFQSMADTLFAPDARLMAGAAWPSPTTQGGVVPGVLAAGREQIASWYQERLQGFDFTYHFAHAQILDWVNDETVLGAVTGHAEHAADGSCLYAAIRYDDVYRCVDQSWVFEQRRIALTYLLPWTRLGTDFRSSATPSALFHI